MASGAKYWHGLLLAFFGIGQRMRIEDRTISAPATPAIGRSPYATLLALLLGGCTSMTERTMDKIVDSWRGENVDTVVRSWGIPDGQFQGRDGRIYEWIQRESATLPGSAQTTTNIIGNSAYSTTTYNGPVQISGACVRQLSTTPAGIVVAGSWRGNNCCFMAVAGYCASLANPKR